MVGAGHKNADNSFNGVLMGDVEQKDELTATVSTTTGLFGYDNGEQSFGFDIDGHAFIGKSGVGRIYVNGDTGRIISSERLAHEIAVTKGDEANPGNKAEENWTNQERAYDPRGTEINLKNNYIDLQGIGNKARVHLDTRGLVKNAAGEVITRHPYFRIDAQSGNRLMEIGYSSSNNPLYYLRTEN